MRDELTANLSDLRDAASQIRRGAESIRAAVENVRSEISVLAAQIDPQASALFTQLAHSTRPVELTEAFNNLAAQLTRAAEDVDSAARWHGPPLGILWDRLDKYTPAELAPAEPTTALPAYTLGSYISRANRPLYDALLADQAALETERANIAALSAKRDEAMSESIVLKDRLLAYGETTTVGSGAANIAAVPRMQALDQQIAEYDREITAAEVRAEKLDTRINAATARLIAVTPPDSADVHVIRGFEGGESASYVLANTRDCVNYIASRVPIPGELAANAHLWDERAAELTRFGIRAGDQPLTGAVLVLEADHPYADDRYGHVMLVEHVDSAGSVWITDNNHASPVRLSDLTTETTGPRVKYLYLPWFTRA